MMTIRYIIKKELKELLRERLLLSLGFLLTVLLSLGLFFGWITSQNEQSKVEQAQIQKQEEWTQQSAKHPHIAAHYGTYVFKPVSALSLVDPGLANFTGTSVYLEAHYQHEFMFQPAQDHSSMIRFGQLTPALVLQILLPLLIIFLTFNSFTKEKESGTLKLLVAQGIPIYKLFIGKIGAYFLVIFAIVAPFFVAITLFALNSSMHANIEQLWLRIFLLSASYLLYILIILSLSILISEKSSNSRNALLTLLSIWFIFTVIIPKATSNIGESLYPLPSLKEYKQAIQQDTQNGLNDDGDRTQRRKQLEEKYLSTYKVNEVSELPFNIEGIQLQYTEEYGAKVQKHHKSALENTFHKQNSIATYASLINPFIAIREISMALSASDLYSFIHFQDKVADYRLNLIKIMNDDMAYNTKYGEFFEYKADAELWNSVPPFAYSNPSIKYTLQPYVIEITALFLWVLLLVVLLFQSSKKFRIVHG